MNILDIFKGKSFQKNDDEDDLSSETNCNRNNIETKDLDNKQCPENDLPKENHTKYRPEQIIRCPEYRRLTEYGYIRTIADVIKCMNVKKKYTNSDELIADLQTVIEPYKQRGTVSESSVYELVILIRRYGSELFRKGRMDINELAFLIDGMKSNSENPIDEVYSMREKAKLLYVIEFANSICHYTNAHDMEYDLRCLCSGKSYFGWNVNLMDDSHPHVDYGVRAFLDNIKESWENITNNNNIFDKPVLDNSRLESYMFTDHERKLLEQGLAKVIKDDYEVVSGCHSERLLPKRHGTGPVYVYGKDDVIEKACYPSDDNLIQKGFYEKGFMKILLRNMVLRGEYKEVEGYRSDFYIPIKDKNMPIYSYDMDVVTFNSKEEESRFFQDLSYNSPNWDK